VFCGHEYTLKNLEFAKYLEPDNPLIEAKIKLCKEIRERGDFTVGSKLIEERLCNPFIRCATEEHYRKISGESDPVKIFAKIRKLKDDF